jgi:tetratricopeptide (TPR) repeat protein
MQQIRLKLTWSLALLALPLGAQTHGDQRTPLFLSNAGPVFIDPLPARHTPSGTISTELLRYPLSEKARHMLQKALQIADAGDHVGAIKQLKKTLGNCPGTEAYVFSLLGVEYLKTNEIPEAIHALEQAVNLVPHDASNHANLGLALLSTKEYERAEPELKRALDLDPHYAMATQLLTVMAFSQTAQK